MPKYKIKIKCYDVTEDCPDDYYLDELLKVCCSKQYADILLQRAIIEDVVSLNEITDESNLYLTDGKIIYNSAMNLISEYFIEEIR